MRDSMSRSVARLYARRREAIERHVPFRLPEEGAGQGAALLGRALVRAEDELSPCRIRAGQGGQGGRGAQATVGENSSTHPSLREGVARERREITSHGYDLHPDHPDHPDRASNGADIPSQGDILSDLTALTWDDDRALLALWRSAGPTLAEREPVLRAWLDVAPSEPLPRGLAALELRRIASSHGIVVEVAP